VAKGIGYSHQWLQYILDFFSIFRKEEKVIEKVAKMAKK
jgi:hypothetical protein